MIASQFLWTSKSVDLLCGSLSDAFGQFEFQGYTYYAGNRRILKAAATKAHCAREG